MKQPKIMKDPDTRDFVNQTAKGMTLVLTEDEMKALDELAARKGMSKKAVIRQALRLYYMSDLKLSAGQEMCWRDPKTGRVESTIIIGACGGEL